MTVLKCRTCGGNIHVTGEGRGLCENCGNEIMLPKVDDDKRREFFNRGNHARQQGDFDRAYSAFEHIIADDMQDAEAHWSLLLCRYGVEYVHDSRSGEYLPTVSRMSYSPVLEDPDYLMALRYATPYMQEKYREDALKIAKIQEEYIGISRREKPYDVFICFKAEEDSGQRTQGSIVAQDIYEELTEQGVRTFFSRVTLRNIAGEKYEPYIFAALNSAKVMLVVTSNLDHLQARWVRNEWSRFLNMRDKDPSKKLIVVHRDIAAKNLPEELLNCGQAVDASVLGFQVGLKKRVMDVLGKREQTENSGTVDVRKVTVDNLLIRGRQSVEDGEFKQAATLLEQVLSLDPQNGEAFYYRLLTNYKVTHLFQLPEVNLDWIKDPMVKRVLQYGSDQRRAEINETAELTKREQKYRAGVELFNKKNYVDARAYFKDMPSYKNVPQLLQKCEAVILHDTTLKEYKELVGDGKEYLTRLIKKQDNASFEKYKSLYSSYLDKDTQRATMWVFALFGLFFAVIGAAYASQLLEIGRSVGQNSWLVHISIMDSEISDKMNFWWPALYGFGIFVGAWVIIWGITDNHHLIISGLIATFLMILPEIIECPYPSLVYPGVGVLLLIIGIINGVLSIGKGDAEYGKNEMYREVIKPFEERERERIEKKYGSVLRKDEMVELHAIEVYGVW